MDDSVKSKAAKILADFLVENGKRKTPERFSILNSVYSIRGHFSLDELDLEMKKNNFRVSKATLYNTMGLLLAAKLAVRHYIGNVTTYEATIINGNHCHQICTTCGKLTEVNTSVVNNMLMTMKLKRFHQEGFTLYFYGTCSSCQTKLKRKLAKKTAKQNQKQKK
ncbi:MAG: transcriptional repressor [Prevotella sp.]|nr:transcriptional repressor [Prevotella sp.]